MDSILADFSAPAPGIRIKRRWNASAKVLIGSAAACLLMSFIVIIITAATLKVVPWKPHETETDDDSPVIGRNGAASSGNSFANQAAVDILQSGGNAVDAAIAAALVIGVRNSFASGIGGGGVMLIHLSNGTDLTIDCRETAPRSSYRDIYVEHPGASQRGGLSIGTPGELLCLDHAWRNYGSLRMGTGRIQWAQLFTAAINDAKNGFPVTPLIVKRLNETLIMKDEGMKSVWTRDGVLLKEGDIVKMPKLAETLAIISREGVRAFYDGSLTQTVLAEINSFGGQFVLDDIKKYSVNMDGVISTTFDDYKVVGAPLPFGGSLMMMQTLNVLETFELGTEEGYDTASLHFIIEASKFAFGNRLLLGDPHHSNLSRVVSQMLSKDFARTIAAKINPTSTQQPLSYITLGSDEGIPNRRSIIWPANDHGTTHISVVDSSRMAVAFTTSVNWGWGSGNIGNSTGILYNNQLDDFSLPTIAPSWPNDPANFPGPLKRPLSSMTPTFVFDQQGRLIFVAGGAGGPKIFSGTLQTFLNIFEFKYNVKTSAKLPRYHDQLNPEELLYEDFMVPELVASLAHLGHKVKPVSTPFNYINTIQIQWANGNSTLEADSDWRKDAISKAYKKDSWW
jgi:gamma-glutamyltranspeptidase/glutathione hydrolase/leukotriene-C4 hydrolase